MTLRLAFDRLVHSDWSVSVGKRWTATAIQRPDGWQIESLEQTPTPDQFLTNLFQHTTLAGFDFPIGLPSAYLSRFSVDFIDLVRNPSLDRAQRFFDPANNLFDVSLDQPFYRRHPKGGRHSDLYKRLGCERFEDLLRGCDKQTPNRNRAESIFWTVGAKQVGKAALSGWQQILVPALKRGARLWPFDGTLASLASHSLTIAETYPAEAYQHVGMARTIRKRSQKGRMAGCDIMLAWASKCGVRLSLEVEQHMRCGFGEGGDGEDPFDAIAGLCGMIEVVDGRRPEAPEFNSLSDPGEGWILGQLDVPSL